MKKVIAGVILVVLLVTGLLLLGYYGFEINKFRQESLKKVSEDKGFNKNKKTVVFVTPQSDYPVWLQAKKGFDDASRDFGFYGKWAGSGNLNINNMLKEIDIAVEGKADAIITCPLNPVISAGNLQKSKKRKFH